MGSENRKHVTPGDWRTLETTFNQGAAMGVLFPAGAKIKVSHWLFSGQEQTLDGVNIKILQTSFGKFQILVQAPTEVTYSWEPRGGPGTLPPIKF